MISFTWSISAFSCSIARMSPAPPSRLAVKIAFTAAPKVVPTILGRELIFSIFEISTVGRDPVSVIGRDRPEPRSVRTRQPTLLPHTTRGRAFQNRVWLFRACHTLRPYVALKIPVAESTVKYDVFCMKSGPKTFSSKPRPRCA